MGILSHAFLEKFRESNGFTKQVTEELIWRNIFSVRENFSFSHTVWDESEYLHNKLKKFVKSISTSFFLFALAIDFAKSKQKLKTVKTNYVCISFAVIY